MTFLHPLSLMRLPTQLTTWLKKYKGEATDVWPPSFSSFFSYCISLCSPSPWWACRAVTQYWSVSLTVFCHPVILSSLQPSIHMSIHPFFSETPSLHGPCGISGWPESRPSLLSICVLECMCFCVCFRLQNMPGWDFQMSSHGATAIVDNVTYSLSVLCLKLTLFSSNAQRC